MDRDTGKRTSKGNAVKFNRGGLVLTDCNVTGSNYGTSTKPNFLSWNCGPQWSYLKDPGGGSPDKSPEK